MAMTQAQIDEIELAWDPEVIATSGCPEFSTASEHIATLLQEVRRMPREVSPQISAWIEVPERGMVQWGNWEPRPVTTVRQFAAALLAAADEAEAATKETP